MSKGGRTRAILKDAGPRRVCCWQAGAFDLSLLGVFGRAVWPLFGLLSSIKATTRARHPVMARSQEGAPDCENRMARLVFAG